MSEDDAADNISKCSVFYNATLVESLYLAILLTVAKNKAITRPNTNKVCFNNVTRMACLPLKNERTAFGNKQTAQQPQLSPNLAPTREARIHGQQTAQRPGKVTGQIHDFKWQLVVQLEIQMRCATTCSFQ